MKKFLVTILLLALAVACVGIAFAEESEIAATALALRKSKITISLYKELQLTISKLSPANATLFWSTSNDKIVTVDQEGNIKAVGAGKATVTVSSVNGKKSSCVVTVKRISVKKITMANKTLSIRPGKSTQLTYTMTPSNASDPAVEWVSSDPTKVTVEQDGTIHALAYTTTPVTISALSTDGSGVKGTCKVSVQDTKVKAVKMALKSVTVSYGIPKTIHATVVPATADNTELEWSSTKPSVATVDENGLVTPHAAGKTKIIATAKDGSGVSGTCTVTVKTVAVKTITLDNKKLILDEGGSQTLTATVKPDSASFPQVTWKSSNESIATVDENGCVTAVSGGYATITASADNGKKKAVCKIYVYGESTTRLVISAVGDVALGGDPRTSGKNVSDPGSQARFKARLSEIGGIDGIFQNVKDVLLQDDVTIMNLECTLSNRNKHRETKPILIIGSPSYAKYFRSNGIEVAAVENNHSKDAYDEGYADTIRALKNNSVRQSGDFSTTVATYKGVKIGFISIDKMSYNVTHMRNRIKKTVDKCDYLILNIHWSVEEFKYQAPTSEQVAIAHAAIDEGVDLVLGTHSHRINGIECYKNKYIVYDLGTFVNYIKNPNNTSTTDFDSFIFQISYYVFDDGTRAFDRIKVIPCAYSSSKTENDMIPMIYTSEEDKSRVIGKIQRYSNITIED